MAQSLAASPVLSLHNASIPPIADVVRKAAIQYGVPESKIVMHGLPIRPAFSLNLPSKAACRKALGMDPAKPAVLVVGGGEGMGPVEKQVKALARELGGGGQVAVICGRNQALVNKLKGTQWPDGMKVTPHWKRTCMNLPSGSMVSRLSPDQDAQVCGLDARVREQKARDYTNRRQKALAVATPLGGAEDGGM